MVKPVLLTVDDDPEVLQAIARDLRQQYGKAKQLVAYAEAESKPQLWTNLIDNAAYALKLEMKRRSEAGQPFTPTIAIHTTRLDQSIKSQVSRKLAWSFKKTCKRI